MSSVDLNCDMGESFGAYRIGRDDEMMRLITSANIACGFHAGDPATMRKTVKLALSHGTAIGAHPGLPDLAGFGRREMEVSPREAYEMVVYQIGALSAFVRSEGGTMRHVKAHGALYNMSAKHQALAEAVAEAVYKVDPALILFGLSGSELIRAGRRIGLATASEAFADRTYQSDGSLTPRRSPDAMIANEDEAVRQAVRMVKEGKVTTRQQVDIPIEADTICIHGDGPQALAFAANVKQALERAGVAVKAAAGK